jgi:hypothetical protein
MSQAMNIGALYANQLFKGIRNLKTTNVIELVGEDSVVALLNHIGMKSNH